MQKISEKSLGWGIFLSPPRNPIEVTSYVSSGVARLHTRPATNALLQITPPSTKPRPEGPKQGGPVLNRLDVTPHTLLRTSFDSGRDPCKRDPAGSPPPVQVQRAEDSFALPEVDWAAILQDGEPCGAESLSLRDRTHFRVQLQVP